MIRNESKYKVERKRSLVRGASVHDTNPKTDKQRIGRYRWDIVEAVRWPWLAGQQLTRTINSGTMVGAGHEDGLGVVVYR